MKQGMTISEMAASIERNEAAKKDYVADTRNLAMTLVNEQTDPTGEAPPKRKVVMDLKGIGYRNIDRNAHRQIAQRVKIPAPYYDRMREEAPELLAQNVNTWWGLQPEKRMIRTLDMDVRAFLSERYRPLDNFGLVQAVLPILMEQPDMRVESCDVSPHRMMIKALFPRMEGEISVGDTVQSGIVISNNEVGGGGLQISPLVFRLVCSNGMIASSALRKNHVGRALGNSAEDQARELFQDETLKADDKAFWLKVQDVVRSSVNEAAFKKQIDEIREASGVKLEADPITVVENTARHFQLNEGEQRSVLTHLVDGGDLSQWGLLNAITAASQDVESYDRATEMERMGGRILELPRDDWKTINQAA